MARLNEPTVSTDTLETLRRKFLRQNRDIARINSTQSLKIRNLENECARLLSENLQLRSETLRLKTELEGSHAHRIAEHALQIKEKMEAQLVEWGAMLAGLGHEPLRRNRSPRALKKPRIQRDSIGRTRVADWRRRETMGSMEDLEAAALQEGRLPPLWENKTYPRETLSGDEILALCSEAEESTDSLEFGPPPVSRFIDEDPVKLDLSTLSKLLKPAISESETSEPEDTGHKSAPLPVLPSASTKAQNTLEEKPKVDKIENARTTTGSTAPLGFDMVNQASKATLKRKSREDEEKENAPLSKPLVFPGTTAKNQFSKITIEVPKPSIRPIKELPTSRKDIRDKPSQAQRKPLSVKSSNEALRSPKKSAHAQVEGKNTKPKADEKKNEPNKSHIRLEKGPAPIEIPSPSLPEAAPPVDIEPETLSAEPTVAVPDSPESCATKEMHDTPPPVDISSRGETTRANRRARAAVSYAEPNLRDKMRRPNTKQLFDAVTSENKNVRRTSQCQRDEPPSATSSVAKSGARSGSSHKDLASQKTSHDACGDNDIMASPLAQKTTRTSALEELPSTVSTHRKKKDSATTAQNRRDNEAPGSPISKAVNRRLEEIAAREVEVAKMFDESDVYEFTESSPNGIAKEPAPEDKSKKAKGSRQSRSRRLSSMARDDLQPDTTNISEKSTVKNMSSRKRVSMVTVRSTKSDPENIRGESPSVDGDSVSTVDSEGTTIHEKPTSNRRRTTMI